MDIVSQKKKSVNIPSPKKVRILEKLTAAYPQTGQSNKTYSKRKRMGQKKWEYVC